MNKKKLIYGLVLPLLAVVLVSAAVYLYVGSASVDVRVDESLSVTRVPISFDEVFPGETATETITIENIASVPLNVELTYTEFSNRFLLDNTDGECLPYPSPTCEKRIDFDGMALSELGNISWKANVIFGYLPHVDVRLDNGETLVFEYAKVDPANCENIPYPTGEINTFGDKGIVDSGAYAWLSSGASGPGCVDVTTEVGTYTTKTLDEWKAFYPNAQILRIEIEVDNWMKDLVGHQFQGIGANSEVWDVVIDGVAIDSGVIYIEPFVITETIPAKSSSVVDVNFTISPITPIGKFVGVVNVERVA